MKTLLMWILFSVSVGVIAKASYLFTNKYPRTRSHRDDLIDLCEGFAWIIVIVRTVWCAK